MTREPREVWEKRVQRWAESGLTAKEFAAEIGVNVHTLTHWKWRLTTEAAGRPLHQVSAGMPAFVEVVTPLPVEQVAHVATPQLRSLRARVPARASRARPGAFRHRGAAPPRRHPGGPLMLPTAVRIFVCTVPQEMRRSFDALALVVQQLLGQDPMSGALYVFVSKSSTRAKVLWWDRNGYCLLYKRLHRALFRVPEAADGGASVRIDGPALAQLLAGVGTQEKKRTGALTPTG